MKPFVVTLLALAAASAEINVAPGGPSGPNNLMGTSNNIVGGQSSVSSSGLPTSVFAESRNAGDSYGAPSAPIIDSYSSSSNAAWASDPAPQAYPYNFGGGASFGKSCLIVSVHVHFDKKSPGVKFCQSAHEHSLYRIDDQIIISKPA